MRARRELSSALGKLEDLGFVRRVADEPEAWEIRRILKPDGCAVIQYSDKNKEAARAHGEVFADTTPEIIRPLVEEAGYRVLEEDTATLWHSSVIRFCLS